MESIFTEFNAGMEHIYNTFFISFLALKPFQEKPFLKDYIIPIKGLAHNRLEASQLNALGEDSIVPGKTRWYDRHIHCGRTRLPE